MKFSTLVCEFSPSYSHIKLMINICKRLFPSLLLACHHSSTYTHHIQDVPKCVSTYHSMNIHFPLNVFDPFILFSSVFRTIVSVYRAILFPYLVDFSLSDSCYTWKKGAKINHVRDGCCC